MKRARTVFSLLVVVSVVLLPNLLPAGSVLAQAETTRTVLIFPASAILGPAEQAALAECAGEEVNFTEGVARVVFSTTTLPDGRTRISFEGSAQGVSGTGTTSGATYRLTGALNNRWIEPEVPPLQVTLMDHLNIVGPGEASNLRVFVHFHLTVNANGEATALLDNVQVRCQ